MSAIIEPRAHLPGWTLNVKLFYSLRKVICNKQANSYTEMMTLLMQFVLLPAATLSVGVDFRCKRSSAMLQSDVHLDVVKIFTHDLVTLVPFGSKVHGI